MCQSLVKSTEENDELRTPSTPQFTYTLMSRNER